MKKKDQIVITSIEDARDVKKKLNALSQKSVNLMKEMDARVSQIKEDYYARGATVQRERKPFSKALDMWLSSTDKRAFLKAEIDQLSETEINDRFFCSVFMSTEELLELLSI